jgi:hypothetical protein
MPHSPKKAREYNRLQMVPAAICGVPIPYLPQRRDEMQGNGKKRG